MLSNTENFLKNRTLIYFSVGFILLYFVFSPAINILYYHGDDFRYAFGGPNKACSTDDGFYFMQTLGRPLQAYLDCFAYKFAFTLERMSILRIVSVAFMAGAIALLADWLFILGLSFWSAFFIAGSMIVVPRLYDDTITTAAISLPISIIFALLAHQCVSKAHQYHDFWQKKWLSRTVLWSVAAIACLIIAFLSYPATSFIFGTLILSRVLFTPLKKWEDTRSKIIWEVSVFSIACILYFIWAFLNMRYNPQAPIPPQYHVDHPNFSLLEIFSRLGIILNVFSVIWELFPLTDWWIQGWVMLTIFTVGCLMSLLKFTKKTDKPSTKNWLSLLQATLACMALFMLSSAFFLIIPTRDMGSRLLFGPLAAGMIILVWCLYHLSDIYPKKLQASIFTIMLALFFLTEANFANKFELTKAIYSAKRMDYIGEALAPSFAKKDNIKRIHFVVGESEYPYNRFFQVNGVLSQLFGRNKYQLAWCSLPRGVPGKEKDHQSEMLACLEGLPNQSIGVTYSYLNEPITQTKDMLIIRMDDNKL